MDSRKPDDDAARKNRAGNTAALRLAVAAYLLYLGWSILRDTVRGTSAMSPVLGWAAGVIFIACAVGFGWYSWKRWVRSRDE